LQPAIAAQQDLSGQHGGEFGATGHAVPDRVHFGGLRVGAEDRQPSGGVIDGHHAGQDQRQGGPRGILAERAAGPRGATE
jgi:hypothetical protein